MTEKYEFKYYIDVPSHDILLEENGKGGIRIYFRSRGVIDTVLKLMEDLRIYAKYRDR